MVLNPFPPQVKPAQQFLLFYQIFWEGVSPVYYPPSRLYLVGNGNGTCYEKLWPTIPVVNSFFWSRACSASPSSPEAPSNSVAKTIRSV